LQNTAMWLQLAATLEMPFPLSSKPVFDRSSHFVGEAVGAGRGCAVGVGPPPHFPHDFGQFCAM